jgi:hypothetical protein
VEQQNAAETSDNSDTATDDGNKCIYRLPRVEGEASGSRGVDEEQKRKHNNSCYATIKFLGTVVIKDKA